MSKLKVKEGTKFTPKVARDLEPGTFAIVKLLDKDTLVYVFESSISGRVDGPTGKHMVSLEGNGFWSYINILTAPVIKVLEPGTLLEVQE